MPSCSVLNCTGVVDGQILPKYAFPEGMKKKWVEQINRPGFTVEKVTRNSRVCERHFADNSFIPDGEDKVKRSLKLKAFPTLFLNSNPKHQKVSENVVQKDQKELIEKQARQIETLKRKYSEISKKSADQEVEMENQKVEMKKLKRDSLKLEVLNEKLGEMWNEDQIERILLPPSSHPTWFPKTLEESIKILGLCGGKGLEYITDDLKLPYAKRRTCQSHLATIDCEAGEMTDFFKLLEFKTKNMSEQERCCALNIDEMTLQAKYQYDTSKKRFIGHVTLPLSEKQQEQRREKFGNYENETEIATHALNAILYGISTFWKQFIAFHFTGNSFCAKSVVDWIVSILRFCFKINLNPLLLSMDSGKSNIAV